MVRKPLYLRSALYANLEGLSATVCLDGGRHSWQMIYMETVWDADIKHCWCVKCGSRTEFQRKKNMVRDRWRRVMDVETGKLFIEFPTLIDPERGKKKRLDTRKHMLELARDTDRPLGKEGVINGRG